MPGVGCCATRARRRLVVIVAKPDSCYHLGNVANKPEVASLVRGAGLAGHRAIIELSRTTCAIVHNAPQHPSHDCRRFLVDRPLTLNFLLVNHLTVLIENAVNTVRVGMNPLGG